MSLAEEPLERPARYSDLFAAPRTDHVGDCAFCPICSAISIVRRSHPELLDHLTAAARELLTVAGIVLEEAGGIVAAAETRTAADRAPRDGVTRIDSYP